MPILHIHFLFQGNDPKRTFHPFFGMCCSCGHPLSRLVSSQVIITSSSSTITNLFFTYHLLLRRLWWFLMLGE